MMTKDTFIGVIYTTLFILFNGPEWEEKGEHKIRYGQVLNKNVGNTLLRDFSKNQYDKDISNNAYCGDNQVDWR